MRRVAFTESEPEGYSWFNPPSAVVYTPDSDGADGGSIEVTTDPETDFWQRSHYGFQRDNGHCLLRRITGEFSFSVRVTFISENQYDQCGLMIRSDRDNWIKASIERENESIGRLGSVVTNLGYSDWATQDISVDITAMSYRASRKGNDILLESSVDGQVWQQMRVAHLHIEPTDLLVGYYAASPMDARFTSRVVEMAEGANEFFHEE
jgi:regulation of enolase protein 1 (concanavalin A-like superfamily)